MTTCIYAFNGKSQLDLLFSLGKRNLLVSYYYLKTNKPILNMLPYIKENIGKDGIFILDSGAFSAWNQGVIISIWDYIDFIKNNAEYFTSIVCLDVINNPVYSEINHRIMLSELQGLDLEIIPVFHAGESFSVLDYMIEKGYKYIGISPNNDWMENQKRIWLTQVYTQYNFEELGIKTHGFGYQSTEGLSYLPMTTADAITWKIAAGYGRIMCPVNPSVRYSDVAKGEPDHIDSIPGGHSWFTKEVCSKLNMDPDLLRTDHNARSKYNIEALDVLLSMPKKQPISQTNTNLFSEVDLSPIMFDRLELEKEYKKVLDMGRDYQGTLLIPQSSKSQPKRRSSMKKPSVKNESLF